MTSNLYDSLDPEAPGLDEDTRRRRRVLAEMKKMSPKELFDFAVLAGIFTPEGDLTPPYKDESPSPYRDVLSGSDLDFPILDVLRDPDAHTPMHYEQVVAALRQSWVVREHDVLVRLRRMAGAGLLTTTDTGQFSFAITDEGRAALPAP